MIRGAQAGCCRWHCTRARLQTQAAALLESCRYRQRLIRSACRFQAVRSLHLSANKNTANKQAPPWRIPGYRGRLHPWSSFGQSVALHLLQNSRGSTQGSSPCRRPPRAVSRCRDHWCRPSTLLFAEFWGLLPSSAFPWASCRPPTSISTCFQRWACQSSQFHRYSSVISGCHGVSLQNLPAWDVSDIYRWGPPWSCQLR